MPSRSKLILSVCLFAASIATPMTVRADYRVFVLQISDSSTGQTRTVTTTLDDLQYATYYPVHPNERVSIQTHWKCRNWRSDLSQDPEQRYCPNPRAPAAANSNSSS